MKQFSSLKRIQEHDMCLITNSCQPSFQALWGNTVQLKVNNTSSILPKYQLHQFTSLILKPSLTVRNRTFIIVQSFTKK